jgi:hypothetical protein
MEPTYCPVSSSSAPQLVGRRKKKLRGIGVACLFGLITTRYCACLFWGEVKVGSPFLAAQTGGRNRAGRKPSNRWCVGSKQKIERPPRTQKENQLGQQAQIRCARCRDDDETSTSPVRQPLFVASPGAALTESALPGPFRARAPMDTDRSIRARPAEASVSTARANHACRAVPRVSLSSRTY